MLMPCFNTFWEGNFFSFFKNLFIFLHITIIFRSIVYLIPDTWAYRAKKIKERKTSWKWFEHSLADLCVYIIMVRNKWDGLLRHRD